LAPVPVNDVQRRSPLSSLPEAAGPTLSGSVRRHDGIGDDVRGAGDAVAVWPVTVFVTVEVIC
jgi:hypothetical protein